MAFSFIQVSEEEFRDFGRKHFPGAPQPAVLPPFVTRSANAHPPPDTSPHSLALETAYNAGFGAGAVYGHAAGRVDGYTEGYHAALSHIGAQTGRLPASAGAVRGHADAYGHDKTYEAQGYEGYEDEEVGEEDLGFYSDGVERTISDEDIQFYRRSEIMDLLKDAKHRVAERKEREAEANPKDGAQLAGEGQLDADMQEGHGSPDGSDTERDAAEQVERDEGELQARDDIGRSVALDVSPSSVLLSSIPQSVDASNVVESLAGVDTSPDAVASADQDGGEAQPPSSTPVGSDKSYANKGKKRKRAARNVSPDNRGITYRRIARELDEVANESVELDY